MPLPWTRCTGIFQRPTIAVIWSDALKLGLHDYAVQRTISRPEGAFVFNAGTWQAKLGDKSFHGYYSSILTSEGGQPRIIEETVVVAVP